MLRSLVDTLDTLLSVRKRDELTRRGQASAQLLMLHEIGKAMGGSMESVERTMQLICESVTVILQCERSFLLLVDPYTKDLVAKAYSGLVSQSVVEQLRIPAGQGLIAQVVETGRPLHVENVKDDPRSLQEVIKKLGLRNILVAPLRLEDRVLGVILADSKLAGDPFTDDDLQLLSVLGTLAAISEENAELIARLKKKSARLNAMSAVFQAMAATFDTKTLFDLVLNKAVDITGASGGSVMVVDETGGKLEIVSAQGLSQNTVETLKLELGQGITGWVAREKRSLLVRDVSKEPRYIQANEKVRSELAVPMLLENELVGVINMDAFAVNAFDEDDQALLETFAGVASVAIRNARLFSALKGQKGDSQ
jgi:GAF domain-containing protein